MSAGLAAILSLAVVGFFVGIRQETEAERPVHFAAAARGPRAPAARTNQQLSVRPWSTEQRRWAPAALQEQAPRRDPVTTQDSEAKASALAERAKRRAYEGAPPTIPHPVGQASAVECRACHERGARIGSAAAPPWSHGRYTLCTQCHVPEVAEIPTPAPARGAAAARSSFVGLRGAASPYKYAAGSPPQIPHGTLMRERCDACHGVTGRPGLQSSHPERKSCTQCHAPSALLDQRASL